MQPARATVFNAIFNQISGYIKANYSKYPGVPQFATFSKAYRPYTKTGSDQQPAFYLAAGPQKEDQNDAPGKSRLEMAFYAIIYLSLDPLQQNPTAVEVLMTVLDMVDDALYNQGQPQSLAAQNGGKPLVYNCWIDRRNGNIEIRQPVAVPQAALVIPITTISGTRLMP